jgi:hypothetical protein
MHRAAVVAAAFFALSTGSGAMAGGTSTEPQVWQGQAFITGFSSAAAEAACTAAGAASIGDYYVVIYRPIIPGSPNNPTTNDEGLEFVGGRNALRYHTNNGDSFAKPGEAVVEYLSSHAQFTSTTTASAPFHLNVSPAKITLTTQTVTMSGFLDGWENVEGCNIIFTAALDLRVD